MNRLKTALYEFYRGRYGHDSLNYTLLALALIILIASLWGPLRYLSMVSLILLILVNARALSRNTVKRVNENRKFRELTAAPRRFVKCIGLTRNDPKHKYVLCPKCHQICRIPKGRGKLEVRCPKCRNSFQTRS